MSVKNFKFILIGAISSIIIFILFGIPTDIIPNDFFTRMIPVSNLDVFFLILTSLMLGTYIGLYFYTKKRKKGKTLAYTGAAGSFVAISCPVCIKLLVLIFGAAALMTYLEPLRHYIGFLSLGLIGYLLYIKIGLVKKCKPCYKKIIRVKPDGR